MSGRQSWALLCRCRCRLLLAQIPKGVDRNSELKQRLQLWESGQINALIGLVLGQQNSRPLRRTTGRTQPQTDEQRGRRACTLTARGSISKAMKGLVGGAAQGSADCRRKWTTALIPRSSGIGTHLTSARCVEAARVAWRWRAIQTGAERDEGARTQQNRCPVKLSPTSALGPTGERKGHLDAFVSFAGAGQRRRLFWGLDVLTIKWAIGDLLEECRFLLNTQLRFLKKEKDPTSKQFDDDESIRSLTEAQEVTADVPEDSVTYDQQDVDAKKVRSIQMGELR